MEHLPTVLLAKFVPDLHRMEPRNVGVIVWNANIVSYRFLGVQDNSIRPPSFVKPENAYPYREWIRYLRTILEYSYITCKGGRKISIKDPAYTNTLTKKSKPGFSLVECAKLDSPLSDTEVDPAVDEFFQHLVATKDTSKKELTEKFSRVCESAFHNVGVEFKTKKPIECNFDGRKRHVSPDYYVGNGKPNAIFQRTSLQKEASVNNSTFIIQSLLTQDIISSKDCGIFYRSSDIVNSMAEESINYLDGLCRVIDVETSHFEKEIEQLAKK